MAKTSFADLTKLSADELGKKVTDLRAETVALARGTKSGEVQNVRAYGAKRRELARVLTAQKLASTKVEEK